jgi:homoserine kinase
MVLAKMPGILGVALSGAGPSVLIFLDAKAKIQRARAEVETHLRSHGLSAELITTAIAQRGAAPLRRGKVRLS